MSKIERSKCPGHGVYSWSTVDPYDVTPDFEFCDGSCLEDL